MSKKSNNRLAHIFKGALPARNSKEYLSIVEQTNKRQASDPAFVEFTKKSWEKVNRSLEAQRLSSCDFITEKTLRFFLTEFNTRAWKYGLRTMPMMFNIMEAYFNYRKPETYFELIEEENYLISFFNFIDFITSQEFSANKTLIEENLTADIIYNFNIGNDLEEIHFNSEDGNHFVVAGVSLIRRENEVTVTIIAGKKQTENDLPVDKEKIQLFNLENKGKSELIDDTLDRFKDKDIEFEYIDEAKQYIKTIVVCRLDLDSMTTDARYVAKESNLFFDVISDEIVGFLNEKNEFPSDQSKQAYVLCLQKIENYSAIYEVAKMSLYLPFYFNLNEDAIEEEVIETQYKKISSSPLTKRKYKDVFGIVTSNKSLYTLNLTGLNAPDLIKLRDDLFQVESSGFWKKILPDEIGLDKKGNVVRGKTWVNQVQTWFEVKEKDLVLEKNSKKFDNPEAGYIYILRNPVMDKDVFKIGLTQGTVDERAAQLSKTSVPDRFYKAQEWNVKDCAVAEKEIHLKLNDYRTDPRREFFKVNYDHAIKIIKNVVDTINSR